MRACLGLQSHFASSATSPTPLHDRRLQPMLGSFKPCILALLDATARPFCPSTCHIQSPSLCHAKPHTRTYWCVYMHICLCVCVCVCIPVDKRTQTIPTIATHMHKLIGTGFVEPMSLLLATPQSNQLDQSPPAGVHYSTSPSGPGRPACVNPTLHRPPKRRRIADPRPTTHCDSFIPSCTARGGGEPHRPHNLSLPPVDTSPPHISIHRIVPLFKLLPAPPSSRMSGARPHTHTHTSTHTHTCMHVETPHRLGRTRL
ncbi:unnamed protein product [Protopolystoma xenopodis]|uniref:Uncharacterized protein n=1 Tax=Protopolystoma xenopodis TaxID=117903 RepID=A0A448XHH7_9PLAT|nr:unnamed protein product [Protopolystoma xenopodis]